MTYIHFYNVQQPHLVLVAIENDKGYYYCQVPYVEKKNDLRTVENAISKDTFASQIQKGAWVITKVNGIDVSELEPPR